MNIHALRGRLDELAVDVGRARRLVERDSSLAWTLDRIAGHVASIIGTVEPSAGELVAWTAPDDDQAVAEAIRIVDARSRRLRAQLGYREAA